MSHYVTAKTQFLCENEDVLLSALKARFPEATILRNAKVRGWRGLSQPEADIVVRFRNPESEAQGNYDLGFVRNGDKFDAVAEWGYRAVVMEFADTKKCLRDARKPETEA